MKKSEIEKTKPTFIISVLKVDIMKVGLVFSISNFFITKTSLAVIQLYLTLPPGFPDLPTALDFDGAFCTFCMTCRNVEMICQVIEPHWIELFSEGAKVIKIWIF